MRHFVLLTCASLAFASPVDAQSLQAAVIGNGSYPAAPLANAARDAATVAEALASAGFEVQAHFDVARDDMDRVLAEIAEQFEGAEIGVIYYAGHGFQFDGSNQLLATDVDELTAETIVEKAIPMQEVINATRPEGGTPRGALRLFLVDACRDDPFSAINASFQRGISFEEAGDIETLIAYSTSAGELAFDGPAGGNGPFALALSRALQD